MSSVQRVNMNSSSKKRKSFDNSHNIQASKSQKGNAKNSSSSVSRSNNMYKSPASSTKFTKMNTENIDDESEYEDESDDDADTNADDDVLDNDVYDKYKDIDGFENLSLEDKNWYIYLIDKREVSHERYTLDEKKKIAELKEKMKGTPKKSGRLFKSSPKSRPSSKYAIVSRNILDKIKLAYEKDPDEVLLSSKVDGIIDHLVKREHWKANQFRMAVDAFHFELHPHWNTKDKNEFDLLCEEFDADSFNDLSDAEIDALLVKHEINLEKLAVKHNNLMKQIRYMNFMKRKKEEKNPATEFLYNKFKSTFDEMFDDEENNSNEKDLESLLKDI